MKGHRHEGIYSIDMYAYSSKLKKINSSLKVLFAFLILLISIIADNIYVSIFVILTMSFITIYLGGIKIYEYLSLLTIPIAFMLMGSIAIGISFSKYPIGEFSINLKMFYIYSSYDEIIKAFKIIFKSFGAISCMYMMTLSTNASEIILALRKVHFPKIIIELMNMIYRFIFILIDVECKMKNSAQSRLGYIDFKRSCYSFGNISKNLLIVSMKKANQYYDAMESRCYTGEIDFLEEEKNIKAKHIFYCTLYIVTIIFLWIFFN